jgi:hypothetical protein
MEWEVAYRRPRTDKLIAASVHWAERIMRKIDNVFGRQP